MDNLPLQRGGELGENANSERQAEENIR